MSKKSDVLQTFLHVFLFTAKTFRPSGLFSIQILQNLKSITGKKNCTVSNLCNNTGKFDLITLFKFVSCCFSHHLIYYCLIQNHQKPLNQQVSSIYLLSSSFCHVNIVTMILITTYTESSTASEFESTG